VCVPVALASCRRLMEYDVHVACLVHQSLSALVTDDIDLDDDSDPDVFWDVSRTHTGTRASPLSVARCATICLIHDSSSTIDD